MLWIIVVLIDFPLLHVFFLYSIPPHYLHRDAAAAYEQGQDMYDYYYSRGYYGNEDWSSHDEKLMECKGKTKTILFQL